uniref:Uncharacterized protein n=1 Tax=Ananas comosus var. bracteatus TaxID=296719 RepID=A0A6V7QI40_ANACO|nr:unnamed protein product [Ananas comosus var. bracteatus]
MPGMPALPEDAEACGAAADRALRTRGVELPQQAENGTCPEEGCSDGGAAGCYCGFRLRRLTCGAAEGRRWRRRMRRHGGLRGTARGRGARRVLPLPPGTQPAEEWQQQQQQQHRRWQRQQQRQTGLPAHGLTWLLTKKNGSLYLPPPPPSSASFWQPIQRQMIHQLHRRQCQRRHAPRSRLRRDQRPRVASDGVRPSASSAVQYLILLLALIIILLSTPSFKSESCCFLNCS